MSLVDNLDQNKDDQYSFFEKQKEITCFSRPKKLGIYSDLEIVKNIRSISRYLEINNSNLEGQDLLDSITEYNIKEFPDGLPDGAEELNLWTSLYYVKVKRKKIEHGK